MTRIKTIVLPALLLLLAAGALSPSPQEDKELAVGKDGLTLYPRWNKAFKPLAVLGEGQKLQVLRERGAWKQVQVKTSGQKGWVHCEVKDAAGPSGPLNLPIAASPTTTGLVAKGWSAETYARKSGTDTRKVNAIMNRALEAERFERFIREGGLK
jgi:hypothetical protein